MPFKTTNLGFFDNSLDGTLKFSSVDRSEHVMEITTSLTAAAVDGKIRIRIGGEGALSGGTIDLPKDAAKSFAGQLLILAN